MPPPPLPAAKEVLVLEQLFCPRKVRRIRRCWLASDIERYLEWLRQQRFSAQLIRDRVPPLVRFARFTWERSVRSREQLPDHVDAFVGREGRQCVVRTREARHEKRWRSRRAVEQMLRLIVPGFRGGRWPARPWPFAESAPGFLDYLRDERGLRATTIWAYGHHLRLLEAFTGEKRLRLGDLTPANLTAFVVARSRRVGLADVGACTGVLRIFLRYARREHLIDRDLASAVEHPKSYALATLPRSIGREEVARFLAVIDRTSNVGRRDYAMLLLLATCGLRAREVAAMTLDDFDWRRERLRVPMRKGGHNHLYPLTAGAGLAVIEYLRKGRPPSADRRVFRGVLAPFAAVEHHVVSERAALYLRRAHIDVRRPGSHTLRHSCVQRLVEGGFDLKAIGDFVGHRQPHTTQIYSKVSVEKLREVAFARGEAAL
jgi:integrase/recombinase XerD